MIRADALVIDNPGYGVGQRGIESFKADDRIRLQYVRSRIVGDFQQIPYRTQIRPEKAQSHFGQQEENHRHHNQENYAKA
jgi:hypothetical protein